MLFGDPPGNCEVVTSCKGRRQESQRPSRRFDAGSIESARKQDISYRQRHHTSELWRCCRGNYRRFANRPAVPNFWAFHRREDYFDLFFVLMAGCIVSQLVLWVGMIWTTLVGNESLLFKIPIVLLQLVFMSIGSAIVYLTFYRLRSQQLTGLNVNDI
jgi:hypothetical protein